MSILHVERLGGLANFGGAGARIRSMGQLDMAALSASEQHEVEALFLSQPSSKASPMRDGFRYKLTRTTPEGTKTVEVPESAVPVILSRCVTDEIV